MPTAPHISGYSDLVTEAGRAEQRGDAPLAERYLRQALAHQPDDAQARFMLGTLYARNGAPTNAVVELECAARLRPFHIDTHYNLAVALKQVGRVDDAIVSYRRAIGLHPGMPEAHNNLGNLLKDAGQLADAENEYLRAIELRPDYAEAHNNLGIAQQLAGRLNEAVASYRQALQLRPDFAEAHSNLGTALQERGMLGDAMECFDRAIAEDPANVDAYNNRTVALLNEARVAEALVAADRAAEAGPDHALARTNRAYALLMQGDLAAGFAEMEWRLKTPSFPARGFDAPRWDGGDLGGRTILVSTEQGNGDTIQFARFLPPLRERGARVLLECHAGLVELIRSSGVADEVIARRDDGVVDARFDAYIEIMSLATRLGTTIDTIPCRVPYLAPPPDRLSTWRDRLGAAPGLKVGLVWAGNPDHRGDKTRSVEASSFAPLAAVPGVTFYSLQKGTPASQLGSLAAKMAVADLGPELADFADTAAALCCLDLLISVDTGAAHLAGALGVPVWTLVARVPDWRWMLDRPDTPWYPTMRIVRQDQSGDWAPTIDRVAADLAGLAGGEAKQAASAAPRQVVPRASGPTIGFGWSIGGPIGWGVVGLGMAQELLSRDDCQVAFAHAPARFGISENPLARVLLDRALTASPADQAERLAESCCLYPLGNHIGNGPEPQRHNVRLRIGLAVLEDTVIGREDAVRLDGYDWLLAPTTWCRDLLTGAGLKRVTLLEQGIDPAVFHPAPKTGLLRDRFVVFSGGKLEYRKGQDIVVAAFREFGKRHPDALLVTAWHNPWPATLLGIDAAGHVDGIPELGEDRQLKLGEWLEANGIARRAAVDVGPLPHALTPSVLREADVAVFPNRCEGSTNLVAMEAMACGVPVVLSANTGHLDLVDDDRCYPLRTQGPVAPVSLYLGYDGWGESRVDEVVEQLERVYADRAEAARRAQRAAAYMETRWWSRICDKLVRELGR